MLLLLNDFSNLMTPFSISLRKLFQCCEIVSFMQSKKRTLGTNMNFLFDTDNIQWFEVKQAHSLLQA